MSFPLVRRIATLLSLAACLCASRPALAAEPETPPEELAKSSAPDSTRLLPPWLHLHAAAGLGWIASPEKVRQLYQAAEGFELGLEARPSDSWRWRLNAEYQALAAVHNGRYTLFTGGALDSPATAETLLVTVSGNGWMGSARLEVQARPIEHFWLLGGLGGGDVSAGLQAIHVQDQAVRFDLDFPGSSGWGWLGTVGAIYEFDILGPTLGIEVRTTKMVRPQDTLQSWSVRLGWGAF
jgi:hypothetical protein